MAYELVVIGTSWGGLHALRKVLSGLPAGFDLPVVVVQHRHRDSDHLLVSLLQDHTPLRVCEVEDKSELAPGDVYVAPAEYHVLVEPGHLALSTEEPIRFSRPSIDVTFESAADAYGARTIGIVMTGANDDGARGLRRIADRGGAAIVQDPSTAESAVMPTAALRMVPEAKVAKVEEIGKLIARLQARQKAAKRPALASEPSRGKPAAGGDGAPPRETR
ncbi:MAG: chemotaxis protein CheB [Gemmatimonadaceae bacterium]|nr:chemotaxis protein CheB [Gemmatimonadaceae bacterium]NUS98379.1 chemotaxis protein CheB [Gemmatimonadaceae bacterium]